MSRVEIVHLDSYRKRRDARFRRTLALHAHEPEKTSVLEQVWRAVSLVGADRGAVVWLDEYGPGLAHPHTVLDLGADRPRRFFSPVPLRGAWDTRVPGLLDLPHSDRPWDGFGEGVNSACVVALGSDGPRSWFLVLDSLTPRRPLSQAVSGEVMFLAGEIASIVLHRDLSLSISAETLPARREESFAGWPILKDLEETEQGGDKDRRIRNRFLVTRVVRALVEDDLVADPESMAYQVKNIRQELKAEPTEGIEAELWERVLKACLESDFVELGNAVLAWGRMVDGMGHANGALELLGLAYDLATANGSPQAAADAARFQGKIYRTQAEWESALEKYGLAQTVAVEAEDSRTLATVLDGMANTYRDLGNLPKARGLLEEVLEMGRAGRDSYATAIAHHDLMTVEKLSENLPSAIQHGWKAVQSYESADGSLRALFDLSGVLRESGELTAARDGYSVVVRQVDGFEYRLLSLDAMAYIAALMGEEDVYRRLRARMKREGWENLSPVFRGQVLYYTGLSRRALGWEEEARLALLEALAYAEKHKLNKLIFDIERELAEDATEAPLEVPDLQVEPCGNEIGDVREGLHDLRQRVLAGAG